MEILLVEDNPHEAELTLLALKRARHTGQVSHVTDGAEALDWLNGRGDYASRAGAPLPRLVLLDLKMPRVDGFAVLREAKSSRLLKRLPIVVFTSSRDQRDLETAYEAGANSYVVKPVDFDAFEAAVAQIVAYWTLISEEPSYSGSA